MIEGMGSNMTAFIVTSILLGAGLAMDAFAVSMANGLVEKDMAFRRRCFIAGIYGAFQFAMPLIGWFFVHGLVEWFESFRKLVPWIALVLLLFIGGKMFYEGYTGEGEAVSAERLTLRILILQGVATSLDALSVGFMLADYSASMALLSCGIIGAVTFFICLAGLRIGKFLGTKFSGKAQMIGGSILIIIGIEIFIRGL